MTSARPWRRRVATAVGGVVVLGLALAPGATSQDPAPKAKAEPALLNPARADDERAIRAAVEAFARAFNAGDLEAVAASFTDDAQVVDEHGKTFVGREAIRARFAEAMAGSPGAVLGLEVRSLQFVGPDTAVERGVATLRAAGGEGTGGEASPYTVVHVRRNGRWLQASVEDHAPAPDPDPGSNEARLNELAWLVGDWVEESAEGVVLTSCRWDPGKNFLLEEFTIRAVGKPVLSGTQRIGWDAGRKQIRSWVFDSEGGFGEATWSRGGAGRWVARAHGIRRDGRTAEATRVLTRLDAHRARWESVDRTLDGEALPDVAFVMVRKPPAPAVPVGSGGAGAATKPAGSR